MSITLVLECKIEQQFDANGHSLKRNLKLNFCRTAVARKVGDEERLIGMGGTMHVDKFRNGPDKIGCNHCISANYEHNAVDIARSRRRERRISILTCMRVKSHGARCHSGGISTRVS